MIRQLVASVPIEEADRSWFIGKPREDFDRYTGIRRTFRWEGESWTLAYSAARFLDVPDDLRALVVVTQSPDRSCPSMAYDLLSSLRLPLDIPVFDVNQACAGFLYGLHLASALTANGNGSVMLVTVDRLRMEYLESPANKFIFSDAASAAIVEGPLSVSFRNAPEGRSKLVSSRAGFMKMDGGAVFDFVSKNVSPMIRDHAVILDDDAILVQHQSNQALMDLVTLRSGFAGRSISVIEEYGNCSMSSIPVALAASEERLLGKQLLLCGYGAGWSAALCDLYWPSEPICKLVRP
jgi:3-oxoacyl-[acyl-carrier-protein] synthase-3